MSLNSDEATLAHETKAGESECIPRGWIHLEFSGRKLEEGRTLSDYNIQDGAIIRMVLRIPRG